MKLMKLMDCPFHKKSPQDNKENYTFRFPICQYFFFTV
ncbi:hypothetical protein B4110_1264 [Parageobacillus toebii]|uniref:Uncharacterized protein n=1 Tax=Parageobacillus toebii TaxID=153151 RepID=A0A150MZ13_9BACL|nr:hypothetical protein B4110_1264 [Parageobacillus toebii]